MPAELRRDGRFDLAWLGLYLDGVNKHDNYVHVGVPMAATWAFIQQRLLHVMILMSEVA